jgi:cytoskeletal protein CcmA (bactofilin family)
VIHFDEMACLLYLEGQLDPPRAAEIRAHAAACAQCRVLLQALERESKLLSSALQEENEPVPARLLSAPGRGAASWIWAVSFGLFAAGAYWLWANTINPWFDQMTSAGFGGTDLVSILLFGGAFWGGWTDMIDILQVAAVIALGIGVFVLLRRRFRRTAAVAVVVGALALTLMPSQPASAAEIRHERQVLVPATQVVHNDLIVAAEEVRVDGMIDGDLIAFTHDLTVTGHVTGDIIAFAEEVRVDGTVDGNVRVFTNLGNIDGSVGKNITAFANTLVLTSKGQVSGGLIALAANATLDGRIHRDVLGLVGRTYLDGVVGGQVWIRGRTLAITSTAEIAGPAWFEGREQPTVAAGAKLASPLHVEIRQQIRRARVAVIVVIVHAIVGYAAALGLGLLLITVAPRFFRTTLREAGRVGLSVGVGTLAVIAGLFLLVLSVFLIFVGVTAGLVSVFAYAPILYVAQVFVGAWLGSKILGEPPNQTMALVGRLALGLLILRVAGLIPFLGIFVWLAVGLWGTGAVLLGFYRLSRPEPEAIAA